MVVNKNMKNPEAVIKLMNFGNDKLFGGKADPKVFHSEKIGDKQYDYFKENVIRVAGSNPIGGNFGHYKKVTAALSANDPSGLNPEQKDYYDKIVAYNGGDRTAWGTMRVFGPESAYSTIEGVYQNKEQNLKFTKFYGAPTKTMAARIRRSTKCSSRPSRRSFSARRSKTSISSSRTGRSSAATK